MFMLGAIAFGALTSCEDAPAVPPMQKNEQGPVLTVSEVTLTPEAVLSQTLNLDNYVNDPEVALFTVTKDELPEGWTLAPYMEMSASETFDADVMTTDLTLEGDKVYGSLEQVQEAHLAFFGIAERTEQSIYYRVAANIVNQNNVVYHFGGENDYILTGVIKETPMVSLMPTDFWYTPGTWNNWNASASQYLFAKVHDNGKYYFGSVMASGEGFKIANTTDWSGINFGGENGVLSTSGPNIAIRDGAGLYWVKAFTEDANPTYQMAKVTQVGIIGAGGNWSDDQVLTPNEDFTIWTGDVELSGDWKIRYNGGWDFNYGGSLSNLEMDGPNIGGYEGSYTMTINFEGHSPKVTLVAK